MLLQPLLGLAGGLVQPCAGTVGQARDSRGAANCCSATRLTTARQLPDADRLEQVVVGAAPQGLDRSVHVAVAGEQHTSVSRGRSGRGLSRCSSSMPSSPGMRMSESTIWTGSRAKQLQGLFGHRRPPVTRWPSWFSRKSATLSRHELIVIDQQDVHRSLPSRFCANGSRAGTTAPPRRVAGGGGGSSGAGNDVLGDRKRQVDTFASDPGGEAGVEPQAAVVLPAERDRERPVPAAMLQGGPGLDHQIYN